MVISRSQQFAIEKCIAILDGWLNTNDINSPSHYTIIDESMFDLEEDSYDKENSEILGEHMIGLLNIIKNM